MFFEKSALFVLASFMIPVAAMAAENQSATKVSIEQLTPSTIYDLVVMPATIAGALNSTHQLSLPSAGVVTQLNVSDGKLVTAGTPIMSVSPVPTEALQYRDAENALKYLQQRKEHIAELREQELATDAELRDITRQYNDAKAALATLQQQGVGAKSLNVMAPATGVLQQIYVTAGEQFSAGTTLATVIDNNTVRAKFNVAPDKASSLEAATECQMTAVFSSEQTTVTVQMGSLFAINTTTGLAIGYSEAIPAAPQWAVGAAVTLTCNTMPHNGFTVPEEAVLADADGQFVFVVKNGKASKVVVKTGAAQRGRIEILQGVSAGDQIIVTNNYTLSDGEQVELLYE